MTIQHLVSWFSTRRARNNRRPAPGQSGPSPTARAGSGRAPSAGGGAPAICPFRRRLLLASAVLAFLAAAGCTKYDAFKFDEPLARLSLFGPLNKQAQGGGTFYWGRVENTGDVTVQEGAIHITVRNGAGASLGTFQADVVFGYDELAGPVTLLEPGAQGSFQILVPIPMGAIATETFTFTWKLLEEVEE